MWQLDEYGYKYRNYAVKSPRLLFGRPDWKCDKCERIFSGYNKLRDHIRETHAYAVAATVCGCILYSVQSQSIA